VPSKRYLKSFNALNYNDISEHSELFTGTLRPKENRAVPTAGADRKPLQGPKMRIRRKSLRRKARCGRITVAIRLA
jgi:hypothetical protein